MGNSKAIAKQNKIDNIIAMACMASILLINTFSFILCAAKFFL